MPTPGERRALIFIASVAALGVAVRGWREFHPPDSSALAGNRIALARQIEAVDSAIAVSSSKRKPRPPRPPSPPRAEAPRTAPGPGSSMTRGRTPAPAETQPRDPRQAYWDRSLYFDSVRLALEAKAIPTSARQRRSVAQPPPSTVRHPPSAAVQPPLDLDVATIDEVAAIPLIGPALARRIVADRIENGPFGSIVELERVQGIAAAFARRLSPFVTFSRPPRLGSAGERRPRAKSERRPGGESRP
jgi:competence protein ComEA